MILKHWVARLALGVMLLIGALACRTSDIFLAQATVIPTRTVRPTFTPLPPPTDTPAPTATIPPSPTAKPTARPTLRPTARPPTPKPPPPPPAPVAQPTLPQLRYKSSFKDCIHSGQTFIEGHVYDNAGGFLNGVTVAMSGSPDGAIADSKESGFSDDGKYSMIVNAFGASPGQSRWVWVVENGKRASDIVRFDFNSLPDTNPATCWNGVADFVRQY